MERLGAKRAFGVITLGFLQPKDGPFIFAGRPHLPQLRLGAQYLGCMRPGSDSRVNMREAMDMLDRTLYEKDARA